MGSETVQGYGWELHVDVGDRDAFYRFMVFLAPEPAMVTLYGRRGAAGTATVTLVDSPAKLLTLIDKSEELCAQKERKGYVLSRDFTTFEVPAHLAVRGDFKANAHAIAEAFRDSAKEQGTELANAAAIPSA